MSDFDLAEPDGVKVPEQLGFEFVSVDKHQDGRVLKDRVLNEFLGDRNHRVRFAAPLGLPNEAATFVGVAGSLYASLDGSHLVGPQDALFELAVFASEKNELVDGSQESSRSEKRFDERLEVARLLVSPVEESFAGEIPGRSVIELHEVREAVELRDGQ